MRAILAIIAAVAVLAIGGITGGIQDGHSYHPDQIVADGENGGGG